MTGHRVAMLLAAGRGERMRPLSERLPKPLLRVGGAALIERHLHALAAAGVIRVVVNTARHGVLIRAALGDGTRYGVHIDYSDEGAQPLETAGGIARALPMLDERFLVVNADVCTDFDFRTLAPTPGALAHLLLVDTPDYLARGDFALRDGQVSNHGPQLLTYAGIATLSAALFAGLPAARAPLAPLLRAAAERGEVSGQHYRGAWVDVGTPQRLADARRRFG